MRILYIDIDSLRADHLGCYGYHRNTSPVIDALAREGTRFENVYVSDAPCLPSRSSLFSGRFGIHTGVVNHGGEAADMRLEGPGRMFKSTLGKTCWMISLRNAGLRTTTISPFGERHSAWHWYAGFSEIINPGKSGQERADEVGPIALDWLERNGRADNWFLHLNLWDPHTPYRTPAEFGEPFQDDPPPAWMTEEIRKGQWDGYGPHSPQEPSGFENYPDLDNYERMPRQIASMADYKKWIDGYDTGIRYSDHHIGVVLEKLRALGVDKDTLIVLSADHGENQGELNVYGDHQTADQITCRVPLILKGPGIPGGAVNRALHYQNDMAATVIEWAGGTVPANGDGRSFAKALLERKEAGREFLVISQGAWSCQRGVRFDDWLLIRTYHTGYKDYPALMLFDLANDPHETQNLAEARPEVVGRGMELLDDWVTEMMRGNPDGRDPLWTTIKEGGPFHTKRELDAYLVRLRATGRAQHAEKVERLGGKPG